MRNLGTKTSKTCVVLASGGIDSTTAMAMAKAEGFWIYALTFDYGQRHRYELEAAKKVGKSIGALDHLILKIELDKIGGSALTGSSPVPKDRVATDISSHIPVTYVPARNTIFLSFALAWAEVLESSDIFIGINAIDYSGYPDCRPEYIRAFETMANLATKAGVEGKTRVTIHTPLIHMTKAQIIQTGAAFGIDYSMTHSCYDPSPEGSPCGRCDSCILRKKGFLEAGIPDPSIKI